LPNGSALCQLGERISPVLVRAKSRGVCDECYSSEKQYCDTTVRRAVEAAVRNAMTEAPGDWKAWIQESQNAVQWTTRVESPAGLEWEYEFFGQEQTSELIERKIKEEVTGHGPRRPPSS
jgi:hypothetical protein